MIVVDLDEVDRDPVIENQLEMAVAVELQDRQAGQVAQDGNSVIYVLHDRIPRYGGQRFGTLIYQAPGSRTVLFGTARALFLGGLKSGGAHGLLGDRLGKVADPVLDPALVDRGKAEAELGAGLGRPRVVDAPRFDEHRALERHIGKMLGVEPLRPLYPDAGAAEARDGGAAGQVAMERLAHGRPARAIGAVQPADQRVMMAKREEQGGGA